MCYFVEINLTRDELGKRFGIKVPEDPRYTPGYIFSAFTRPCLPVITNDKPGELQFFQWGLIPSWVKTSDAAEKISSGTFNARAETIWEKPSFKLSAARRRCLVPVHGFFEWHTQGKQKIPWYIKRQDNEPFAVAGLFDIWENPETNEVFQTYSVVTTKANPLMEKIHNLKKRMPAILDRNSEKLWLTPDADKNLLQDALRPFPEKQLVAWPVSRDKLLRNPDIHDPGVIEPFQEPASGNSLF